MVSREIVGPVKSSPFKESSVFTKILLFMIILLFIKFNSLFHHYLIIKDIIILFLIIELCK